MDGRWLLYFGVLVLVLIIAREFTCWYFKINAMVPLLTKIENHLSILVSSQGRYQLSKGTEQNFPEQTISNLPRTPEKKQEHIEQKKTFEESLSSREKIVFEKIQEIRRDHIGPMSPSEIERVLNKNYGYDKDLIRSAISKLQKFQKT